MTGEWDAVVVGSGPNGLVAALELARSGWKVLVLERADAPGGGTRTAELTLPGFRHDVCSAIHPLGLASPALRDLDLERVGVEWVHPDAPLAHALRPGHSVLQERSLAATAVGLGVDGRPWERLFGPSVRSGLDLVDGLLDPLHVPPRHPVTLARYGAVGLWSVSALARRRFRGDDGPALLAGMAGHSMLSLDAPITTGFGMLLGQLAHVVGWPMARGGSQAIADGLVALIEEHGGTVRCGEDVRTLDDVPPARAVLCDVTPRQLVALAGDRLPSRYRRMLERYRYGAGVCKVDWALDGPVPWKDPATARAGTVHLGGTLAEVRASEEAVVAGRLPEVPFMLLAQQSNFDPTRAPAGTQTLWGYCHVPAGCDVDMTAAMEDRIEAFAPGFKDLVLARHTMTAPQVEAYNPNYIGGDINGGVADLRQFLLRPVPSLDPWATPVEGLYLCSSATPPGGGVHGMCGRAAARSVLRRQPL
ncbi:phytoene desaturase family protein [Dermatobacter hominis]|uniref:phytoene desaturase family protein n=1 Tax=Dermatobacter hominis TaxID=2884263 RepID=UPI001D10E494|nr:NAD(P)/FAD-dependent oxidoreductase [Dermatobacter hominis]UDY34681.1 NAD(P)/FAD-dependent oxidoreductase [Dermatobacter hominis]